MAVKLNNYLTEFPTPMGVKAKKLDQEELLEVLGNRIPTLWKFQMDKEGFNASSSTFKDFTKTCAHYKECKPKITKKKSVGHKSHSEIEGKHKAKLKADEKTYHERGELLHAVIKKVGDISIASTMGITTTSQMSATSPSTSTKDAHTMNMRKDPARARRCTSTVKIVTAFSPQERQISTSLRPYPSHLEVMMKETVIATPRLTTPPTKTRFWSETTAMDRTGGWGETKGQEKILMV
eukprot:2955385-Ditylum_brightwellii.AAC.1